MNIDMIALGVLWLASGVVGAALMWRCAVRTTLDPQEPTPSPTYKAFVGGAVASIFGPLALVVGAFITFLDWLDT